MRPPTIALVLASLVVPGLALAEATPKPRIVTCAPTLSSEAWLVRTGGHWTQGKRYGWYRAVVFRKGIEHASDWIQLQVLEADDQANATRLRTCVNLETPGLKGYVTDVSLTALKDSRAVLGIDIAMKAMNDIILREVYLLTPKGEVTQVAAAKYVEVD